MHRFFSAGAFAVAFAVTLFASGIAAAQQPIKRVYRADSRPPAEIFLHGFSGRGNRMDVLAHTLGGACEETDPARASVWVSTSSEREEAVGFATGHLEGLDAEGPATAMYIYTIRADATYVSVPALMRQVADAGRAGQSGYNIAHADVIDRLLVHTAIATEEEVITHHVNPYNILHAVPTYFVNGDLVQGTRIDNTGYFDDDTQANSHVSNLQSYVPAASIRTDLASDTSDDDACSMMCDGATSASSRLAPRAATRGQCGVERSITPLIRQVILDS